MRVVLTTEETNEAISVAKDRSRSQHENGRPDTSVIGNGIEADTQGCKAELAASKALSIPWTGKFFEIEEWKKLRSAGPIDDIGKLQVRSTRYNSGSLLLHRTDKDDDVFILVIANDPEYTLAGWIAAKDGKQEKWWHDVGYKRPCFFVPQSALKPMTELVMS